MGNLICRQEEEENENTDWARPEQEQKDEEPLDLAALSQELIHSIVEKLTYKDYAQLEETSNFMSTTLNSCAFSLPHSCETIYINKKTVKMAFTNWYYNTDLLEPRTRWHVATANNQVRIQSYGVEISHRASSSRLKAVTKLFEKNKTTASSLRITERVTFEPEALDRLIQVLKIGYLECHQFLPREFFTNSNEGLNKVEHLYLYTTGCTDEELLKLKAPSISMENDFITDRGINKFLKQWKNKEREINWLSIEFGGTFGRRNFDTILKGLDANPIWTPDLHEYSLAAPIRLEDFALMQTGDPEHLYSMWRADASQGTRLISLSQSRLEIRTICYEDQELLDYLTDDQFYFAMKMCQWCREEFCEHRRRYSSQRFKKFFPRTNDAIISGITTAGAVLFAARCAKLLFMEVSTFSFLSNNEGSRLRYEEQTETSLFNTVIFNVRVYLLNH